MRAILVAAALTASSVVSALAACGEKGGPGYRGPDGKCVGWANIGKVCGNPPTLRCTEELAHPGAPSAAEHGEKALQAKSIRVPSAPPALTAGPNAK